MRLLLLATSLTIAIPLLNAEEFTLTQNGFGPITVHTTVTFEGKGERLVASATNDSGQPIPYVKLCVKSDAKGCLFEIWNTVTWEPGKTLEWNIVAPRRAANLSHQVEIEALNVAPKPQPAPPAPIDVPKPTPTIVAVQPPPAPPGPAILTNDTILKLAKAGLGDEVILGMVNNQQGKYSVDVDSIIALKQAGISDRVISALLSKSASPTPPALTFAASPTSTEPLYLHDGTPVRMRLSRNISSADAKTGDTIDFEVLDDVMVGDLIVIKRGSVAIGSVTDAEKKKRMARGGKLDVTLDYVRLVSDDKVALRRVREGNGGGHTGAMTGAIVATALVVWPAAPFFLFMHGKDFVIPKDTEITAYVNGEIKLDRQKLAQR